jgi:hypothetical protein
MAASVWMKNRKSPTPNEVRARAGRPGNRLQQSWMLAMLAPFYLVIRYGVVAREETYLDRKFGAVYLSYKSRVHRWL